MAIINSRPEFAEKIVRGEKYSNVCHQQHGQVGDIVEIYSGMRSKTPQKLGFAELVCVEPIVISRSGFGAAVESRFFVYRSYQDFYGWKALRTAWKNI